MNECKPKRLLHSAIDHKHIKINLLLITNTLSFYTMISQHFYFYTFGKLHYQDVTAGIIVILHFAGADQFDHQMAYSMMHGDVLLVFQTGVSRWK